MTESETEAETLERLETALRRIAEAAHGAKSAAAPADLDREALIHSLDQLIAGLRAGLNPNRPE